MERNTITKKEKRIYHVHDWKNYNKGLCERYSLDVWFTQETIKKWYYKPMVLKPGATKTYSNTAILTCLQLRALFNLSLRATQGFLDSLFKRMELPIRCPHYSQLCRRACDVKHIKLPSYTGTSPLFALVDSTGLKVYGQGEWHVKMHKASKRRTWRKLHVVIDPISQEIIENKITTSNTHDSISFVDILSKLPKSISRLWGDGAYDTSSVYDACYKRDIKTIIPPQRNGTPSCYYYRKRKHMGRQGDLVHDKPPMLNRDIALAYINQYDDKEEGRRQWKKHSLYHLRSLVETTMMRFKQTFTDKLRSRTFKNQQAEARVKCSILNTMLKLASAKSHLAEFLV